MERQQELQMERQLAAVLKMSLESSVAPSVPVPSVPAPSAPPPSAPSVEQSTAEELDPSLLCQECNDDEPDDERTGEVTCTICCDDKPVDDFRGSLTAGCSHLRVICDLCVVRHIRAEVNGKGNVTQIRCPHSGCGEILTHQNVQKHAAAVDFEAYDRVLIKQSLQQLTEFRWCSRPGCGSRQLVEGANANPIMTCHLFSHRTCFRHRITWHSGKSCEMYDCEMGNSEEAQLVHWIEGNAKRCPRCGVGIEKNEGCDHMTCKRSAGGCGAEFCWRCGADYNGVNGIRAVGNSAHQASCMWYAPG